MFSFDPYFVVFSGIYYRQYLFFASRTFRNKLWYVYTKELQRGLCKVCVIFDHNSRSKPRGKFAKTVFQDVGKSEKIAKYETKEYHKDTLEKAKDFLESHENPTKSVTHDKNSEDLRLQMHLRC